MSSDLFFEKHKPIRNKIRTFESGKLLALALKTLFQTEDNFARGRGYVPWELMLLIRWTLQYKTPKNNPKIPVIQDVNNLLNEIKGLYECDKLLPKGGPHALPKFIRRMALQQFPYQLKDFHLTQKIGRQLILFEDLGKDFRISEKFQEQIGLSIQEFLMICFGIYSICVIQKQQFISPKMLTTFFEEESLQKFFSCTSFTQDEAKIYLKQDAANKGHRFMLQLYEVSPLVRRPFLKIADQYACYSKRLFYYFFSNFIDDFLADNVKDWTREFGSILEKYIKQQLDFADLKYIPDAKWKKLLPQQSQVPDFTLAMDDATVFIESKSKGLKVIPRIYQTNDALAKHLDDSVVKGIIQIYSLANKLRKHHFEDIRTTEKFYGIVVYYKDHYLKGGREFWDEFLNDAVKGNLEELNIDASIIPPENLFLLSIDEFDYLVTYLKNNPDIPLTKVLDQAKEFASAPHTSSFFFEDYLKRMAPDKKLAAPDYLCQRFLAVPDRILERAPEKSPDLIALAESRNEKAGGS